MIGLVEAAPFQASHLAFRVEEHRAYPVDDAVEIGFQLVDVRVVAMEAHVLLHVVVAHPLQGTFQIVLTVDSSADVVAPLLDVSVLRVAELLLGLCDELARIDGIEQLLCVERHTGYIHRLEPLPYLVLCAFAFIDKQVGVEDALLLLIRQAAEVLRDAVVVDDAKLARNEASQRGDALLSVENFQAVALYLIKI